MATPVEPTTFPAGLLEWAGHRSGGVRRLFDKGSGRPSGAVIRTSLLERLEAWVESIVDGVAGTPRIVLLVGGPGNGKTEAVEATIHALDRKLNGGNLLSRTFEPLFAPDSGKAVPRLAQVDVSSLLKRPSIGTLAIVQDASVTDPAFPGRSPASLLVSDLSKYVSDSSAGVYLACVNRGVLDDALIAAIDDRQVAVQGLLADIVRAVGLSPTAPPCWPLEGHVAIAVWPMDVESLLVARSSGDASPARQLLDSATRAQAWPEAGKCPAGDRCPFCLSRSLLIGDPHQTALLQVLRWYELATGKRWSFRDMFSLISFLLAGVPSSGADETLSPCEWAARLLDIQSKTTSKPESLRLRAPFLLVASQYQHALFGRWPRLSGRGFRADLRELKMEGHPTLMGLHHFLSGGRGLAVPATLEPQLVGLSESLDPALADPDEEVEVSSRTALPLRDIDARFSQSTREGLQFLRKYRCLTVLEVDLLQRLAETDDDLGEGEARRRRPATASRLQSFIREFACRLVRRTLGVRSGVVRDAATLKAFQAVIDGDEQLLHDSVKQVEGLLNEKDRFVVTLNTTFGEPLPPEPRRAVLTTDRQKVRPRESRAVGRPTASLRFLTVGAGHSVQSIPMTYELFRSVRELRAGMMPASLPRPVVALLDTTRARLSGQIVRDDNLLDGAEIRIGLRSEVIVRELNKFIVRQEDGR